MIVALSWECHCRAMSILRTFIRFINQNRRRFDRRPVAGHAVLRAGEMEFSCVVKDVSASGAFLAPDPQLPVGAMATLEVPDVLLSADVRVVRRTPDGFGVEFAKQGVGAIIAGWMRGQSALLEDHEGVR
jgi:PilZ domain